MARRVRVGDVIEIPTRVGFGYAQLTHVHPTHGALLRVLPGAHEERPTNLLAVVAQGTDFVAFFPLQAAVNRGIVEIVGGAEIPASARAFPLFKAKGARMLFDESVQDWWLWDGGREWRVGALGPEQQDLPEWGIWNDAALMHEIERRSGKAIDAPSSPEPAELQEDVRHYLYHQSKSRAARLAGAVRKLGLECELSPSGNAEGWLVLVHQAPTTSAADISAASAALEQLAESFNGEYDGLEIPVVGPGDASSLAS